MEKLGLVAIATNGKADATLQMSAGEPAASDQITMVFAAALPLSLHGRPERVANIAFGSGLTSAVERTRQSLEPIEIAPQGYRWKVHDVFEDPHIRIVFENAKTCFAMTREGS